MVTERCTKTFAQVLWYSEVASEVVFVVWPLENI